MPTDSPTRLSATALNQPVTIVDGSGNPILTVTGTKAVRLGGTGGTIGFYGTAPIALQEGVAVTAGGIHAALVALGLITA